MNNREILILANSFNAEQQEKKLLKDRQTQKS